MNQGRKKKKKIVKQKSKVVNELKEMGLFTRKRKKKREDHERTV